MLNDHQTLSNHGTNFKDQLLSIMIYWKLILTCRSRGNTGCTFEYSNFLKDVYIHTSKIVSIKDNENKVVLTIHVVTKRLW